MFLMDAHAFLDKESVTDLLACVFRRRRFTNLGGLSKCALSAHTCSSVKIAWGIHAFPPSFLKQTCIHKWRLTAFPSNNNSMKEKPIQSFMPQVKPYKSFGDLFVIPSLICHTTLTPPPLFLPKWNQKGVNMSTKCTCSGTVCEMCPGRSEHANCPEDNFKVTQASLCVQKPWFSQMSEMWLGSCHWSTEYKDKTWWLSRCHFVVVIIIIIIIIKAWIIDRFQSCRESCCDCSFRPCHEREQVHQKYSGTGSSSWWCRETLWWSCGGFWGEFNES